MMFRILYISIRGHYRFSDFEINLASNDELSKEPFTSLIIGPNGTGKSHLLNIVVEILNVLSASKDRGSLVQGFKFDFVFKYLINGKFYVITYNNRILTILSNNEPTHISEIDLPNKIIASSISLNDRYPMLSLRNKVFNERYEYLGVRSTTNAAYISNHYKNIINSLSLGFSRLISVENIVTLFERLGLEAGVEITYKPGQRLPFSKTQSIKSIIRTEDSFYEYFKQFIDKKKLKSPDERRISKYERVLKDTTKIQNVLNYLNDKSELFEKRYRYLIKLKYTLNFNRNESLQPFILDSEVLNTLIDLELLSVDQITLKKDRAKFHFDQASSGEYHLITSFLSIATKIEPNSLILIDEPEISLHPNWQMQYMGVLNKVFESFNNCHFIIASHSHFLVSDLKPSSSSIISMKAEKDTGRIYADKKSENMYSKSAEEILLEVFEAPTTRNYYVSELVGEILDMMANPQSEPQGVKDKITHLKNLNLESLSESDPLKEIIDVLLAKLDNAS